MTFYDFKNPVETDKMVRYFQVGIVHIVQIFE